LEQISKSNFLADVYALMPVGAIMGFANNITPTGFLVCNGSSVSTATYSSLYSLIGYTYGGSGSSFNLPNMSTSTYVSTGTSTGTYIKYIIKT
jgi:microcystin-dependent protein